MCQLTHNFKKNHFAIITVIKLYNVAYICLYIFFNIY